MSDSLCPRRTTWSRGGPRTDNDPCRAAGPTVPGDRAPRDGRSPRTHAQCGVRAVRSCGPPSQRDGACNAARPRNPASLRCGRGAPKSGRGCVQSRQARSLASLRCGIGPRGLRDAADKRAKPGTSRCEGQRSAEVCRSAVSGAVTTAKGLARPIPIPRTRYPSSKARAIDALGLTPREPFFAVGFAGHNDRELCRTHVRPRP
jgi:hypothetical protein